MDRNAFEGPTLAEYQRCALLRWRDRECLVGDGLRLTYAEFQAQVNRMVRLLERIGLRPGDGLAALSGNRPELLFVTYAAQALGLRYTALHPLGSEDDHAFILEDAEIHTLVLDVARFGDRGRALAARLPGLGVAGLGASDFAIDLLAELPGLDDAPTPITARPHDISVLSYTGGTTGRPKGVVHRHRSVVALVQQELAGWEWPEEIRFLIATPVSHAAGAMVTPTFARGGAVHVLPAFEPEAFLATIERERITATFIVPTMLYVLLDHPALDRFDLSSLRFVVYGGAPMSPVRMRQAIERFGPIFCQLYGQSEAANTITYLSRAEHLDPTLEGAAGYPVPGNQVAVLRPDGSEADVDEVGEICVRGPIVMDGYWRQPELTEAAFAGGWLHTGDLARRDASGCLFIVDRLKDMVVSGGFNVYPREIEDVLARHPAVASAAVFGAPDPKWGEAVRAVVVRRPGQAVEERELIELVRRHKGAVQAPKSVEFRDALPLTAVGKIDRKALRAPYWKGQSRQVG